MGGMFHAPISSSVSSQHASLPICFFARERLAQPRSVALTERGAHWKPANGGANDAGGLYGRL